MLLPPTGSIGSLGRGRCCRGRWRYQRAQEAAKNPAVRIGRDLQVKLVQVDDQAEQVQMQRPEDEIENLTWSRLHRLNLTRRDGEADALRRQPAALCSLRQLLRILRG